MRACILKVLHKSFRMNYCNDSLNHYKIINNDGILAVYVQVYALDQVEERVYKE